MLGPEAVTDNRGLIALMRDADKSPVRDGPRNRSVHTEKLIPLLWDIKQECCEEPTPAEYGDYCCNCDSDYKLGARHLCTFRMDHNGHEWRTKWMVRVKPDTKGARLFGEDIWMIEIWLDFAYQLWEEVTWSVRKEEILRGAEMTQEEHEGMLDGTLREQLR